MSKLHQEHGHFCMETRKEAKAIYGKYCAQCGTPTIEEYQRHYDHIVSLYLFDKAPKFALKIIGSAIHTLRNCWILCDKCHAEKTNLENEAAGNFRALLTVAQLYWARAYTPKGKRKIKGFNGKKTQSRSRLMRRYNRIAERKERAELRAAAIKANQD